MVTHSTLVYKAALLGLLTHVLFHNWRPQRLLQTVVVTVFCLPIALAAISGELAISATCIAYVSYLGTLCVSIGLYRLSPSHPLSRFPGPVLYKLTKLSGVWSSFTGHQHLIVKRLHDKYGPVVRIGPNELSIVDVDAISAVLGASGLPKGEYYDARRDPKAPANLVALNNEAHSDRRRLWNRAMSSDAIHEYEQRIAARARQLQERLLSSSGVVDLTEWIGFFTFDFMGDMAFGGGFEMLREGNDVGGCRRAIDDFARVASYASHIPWAIRVVERLPFVSDKILTLRKMGVGIASARVKAGSRTKDLWYYLSDEEGLEKQKPPVANLVADGVLAIVAGGDTTVSALCSLFFELMSNPECYRKAQAEVDHTYTPGGDPLDASKHEELKYLNACIDESLRLHPPVPTGGPRQVPKGTGGKVIAGHFVPQDTQIYVPPFSLHRDRRYYPQDADAFRPDRWLTPDEGQNSAAFIPFSYGPYNCVGRHLARRELLMVASLLLHTFEMRFAADFDHARWPDTLCDYFISARGPLLIELVARV